MKVRRLGALLLSSSAAAVIGVFGMMPMASASVPAPRSTAGYPVTVINLQQGYLAKLAAHHKQGRIAGIVHPRNKQPKPGNPSSACSEPHCPLVYNGGSVQHSPHVYLLFWGPNWSTDAGQSATASYLQKFYAGLGVQPQDSWSDITGQYGDSSGHPSFSGTVYMGAWHDTSTPPTGVDQAQLGAEADAFASSVGITDLTNSQIIVATQAGTCPAGFYAPSCNGGTGNYCAWHSNSNEPYTNLPYVLDAGSGCGEDFVNPGGTYDGFSIVGGHEYAETATDPFPVSGWWDPSDTSGGEIGDKCAWQSPNGNVALSTGSFAMQSLWSNSASACVMSASGGQDTVTVTSPGNQSTYAGGRLNLQVKGSSSAGLPLTWGATGLPAGLAIASKTGLISGAPTTTGTYSPHVTARDSTPASGSAAFTWTVKADVGTPIKGANAKCLDDKGAWVTSGNKVDTTSCNSIGAQKWSFAGDELTVLGQCLSDPGSGGINTGLVISPCTGASSQLWTHPTNGEYVLSLNQLCLTEVSTTNGTQVQIRTCKATATQKWNGT